MEDKREFFEVHIRVKKEEKKEKHGVVEGS